MSSLVESFRRELCSPGMSKQIANALPAHISTEKFQRVVITAVSMNPDILKADQRSLYAACMRSAQDGLLPDGREAALVSFGQTVQYMPMVAGVLKKLRNSGQIKSICAELVYERDVFKSWIDETGRHLEHTPDWFSDRGKVIGVYAHAVTSDGGVYIEIMNRADIERVRSVSRSGKSGPWVQWWDEMARKTVLRRIAKYLPSSSDIVFADDEDVDFNQAPPSQPPAPQGMGDVIEGEQEVTPEPPPPRQRNIQSIVRGRRDEADLTPAMGDEPPPIEEGDIPI